MRMRILLLITGIVSLLALWPLVAQDEESVAADVIEVVENAVADIPGLQAVVEVSLDTLDFGDGANTVLTVIYLTAESDPFGYRAEMLDVMHVLVESDALTKEDIDQVLLLPSLEEDDGEVTEIEIILADTFHIEALAAGEMTRTEFFTVIDITIGAHQSPDGMDNEA